MLWVIVWTTVFLLLVAIEQVRPVDRKWTLLKSNRLPPGPRGIPIMGNLFQFWKARENGSLNSYLLSLRDFGAMTTLRMGSQLWVLINTNEVATDIISKKCNITSERPHMPISSGLVSNGKRSVLQRSVAWTEPRRIMRQLLTGKGTKSFAEWQDFESIQMLLSYFHDPQKWYLHHSRFATATAYGVVTGEQFTKSEEELAEYSQVTREFLGSLFVSLVDFFPILEHLPMPLQLWRAKWVAVGKSHRRVFKKWWDPVRAKIRSGTANASWARDVLMDSTTNFKGAEEDALYLANSVISAGGDNTRMTLNVFVMVSIHFSEVFLKCRKEIDGVCGGSQMRLPTVDDIPNMPYLCGFIKEIMRWRPIVPLVPPHQLTEELKYAGFVFPKGTTFIINTIATCYDCELPDQFRPERWIDGNETNLTHGFWGFGGGKRVCIGYKAVQPALFLAISRMIYCFNFEPEGDHGSVHLNPYNPAAFPVRISKRGPAYEKLVRRIAMESGLRQGMWETCS